MVTRIVLSLVVIGLMLSLIAVIDRNSAITDAQASILSAQNSDEAYTQSLQSTSSWYKLGTVVLALIALVVIWFGELRRYLTLALIVPLLLIASCQQGQAHNVITEPNEVTFVVQLNGDSGNQAVIGSSPEADVEYWKDKLQNVHNITVQQYCFKPNEVSGCQWLDTVRVITVSTTSVKIEWEAPAIIEGQPFPDMSTAFSMQSLEPNGGSTGVYVGAQIIAHIVPADAALYLASYGYQNTPTEQGDYPARDLTSVLQDEVRAFIQTELNREYGARSVEQQNRDMTVMFDTVRAHLDETFNAKGITIDSFGYRDGNVYENPRIQQAVDSAFDRAQQLEEAQSAATRQAVANQQSVDQAVAEATATGIAAVAASEAQRLLAQTLRENPDLVQLELARRWDGRLPQIMGDSNAVPMIPFALNSGETATPVP